jgi:hypothetical protein
MKTTFVLAIASALAAQIALGKECQVTDQVLESSDLGAFREIMLRITDYDVYVPTKMPNATQLEALCDAGQFFFPDWDTCTLTVDNKPMLANFFGKSLENKCNYKKVPNPADCNDEDKTRINNRFGAKDLKTLGPACTQATGYNLSSATDLSLLDKTVKAESLCSQCSAYVAGVNNHAQWPHCVMEIAGVRQTVTDYFNGIAMTCKL